MHIYTILYLAITHCWQHHETVLLQALLPEKHKTKATLFLFSVSSSSGETLTHLFKK